MNKFGAIIVILIVVFLGFLVYRYSPQEFNSPDYNASSTPLVLPTFSLPSLEVIPVNDSLVAAQAWQTFESYLEFAKNHDLEGLKSLSYQISAACNDPEQEEECVRLMDSVYLIGSEFKLEDFHHIETDGRQIIMSTDGPDVTMLYFIRENDGAPKLLGIQFCREQAGATPCVETDPAKKDINRNGWWDSIESLFYENRA